MNTKLANACACLWLLGLLGMSVSRTLFDLGPGAFPFELCTRLWIVGGLGYLGVGALGLIAGAPAPERVSARRRA